MELKLSKQDRDIILKHDASCRGRAFIELSIVDALIDRADDFCYGLVVEDEEGEEGGDLRSILFDLGDATILVGDQHGHKIGWIRLVFGNDGYDLVSDYSTNLEAFLEPVNEKAKFWGG